MNQYLRENNIVYHSETDNYALNPNVRPLSDLKPFAHYQNHELPSDFTAHVTADQEENFVQTVPMIGILIGLVSIILGLVIGVNIGQGRNVKLEKQVQELKEKN